MGMQSPPEPKGDIAGLFSMLGIEMVGDQQFGQFSASVVWQDYNPYPEAKGFRQITPEWVFVTPDLPDADEPLNQQHPVTSGLNQLLFLFPGAIRPRSGAGPEFTPLVRTSRNAGTIGWQDLTGQQNPLATAMKRKKATEPLILAAEIRSARQAASAKPARLTDQPPGDQASQPEGEQGNEQASATDSADGSQDGSQEANAPTLNVIFVTDIDLLHSEFLRVRAQPSMGDIEWKFDNVTFVLNIVDYLAGDDRFLEVRKKQTRHSTLKLVEKSTADARAQAETEIEKFRSDYERAEAEARARQDKALKELQAKIDELQQKARESGQQASARELQRALQAALQQMAMKEQVEQRKLDATIDRLTRERDRKLQRIERDLDRQIQEVQNRYKLLALLLPMLPPLVIGLVIYVRRRRREREGVSAQRRR